MNFLAHLYLSGGQPKVMVGNFMADFVKGKNLASKYEPLVVTGLELHRSIDYFTDTHKIVHHSKKRLAGKYRHYSAVIVDVFYDHFLSSKWNDYHPEPLEVFAARAYQIMQDNAAILPAELNGVLPYMIKGNWLVAYGTIDGMFQALSGIGRRTAYISNMEKAVEDLSAQYEGFAEDFTAFFPQLKEFANNYLESRYPNGYI